MRLDQIIVFSGLLFVFSNCNKTQENDPAITTGKHRYTITVDGTSREYYVHVPVGHNDQVLYPVVIMLHGSDQNGELFYNISGWAEVGDAENVLTVFPSALKYCITEDGETKNITKWNSYPGGFSFCSVNDLKDDKKFMRQMIAELQHGFRIDSRKVYMVGFSSGGQLSATCAVELSDILTATISCGGGGALSTDSIYRPVRLLPTMLMFGNQDEKMLRGVGLSVKSSVPMGFAQLYGQFPYLYTVQPKPFINTFKLNETSFILSGDTSSVIAADYRGLSGKPDNLFKLVEIKGLGHEYPNGINHPIKGAYYHWNWLKQFSLP